MPYRITIRRKTERGLLKMPNDVQKLFNALLEDLRVDGPIQKTWPNFSPLGKGEYYCHLNYRYVACWTWYKGTIEIEVYYVGSRENAPY